MPEDHDGNPDYSHYEREVLVLLKQAAASIKGIESWVTSFGFVTRQDLDDLDRLRKTVRDIDPNPPTT